jgi:hypothetical protein
MTYETKEQPATLIAAIAKHGLTIRAEFVALSKSRSAKEKYPSLNWRVTLCKEARDILTTDYSAGSAHCPAYKRKDAYRKEEMIAHECEHGFRARIFESHGMITSDRKTPLLPAAHDVIHSLLLDSDVIDHPTFETWASEFGYDSDSRSAEKTYRACLEIALKLRNGVGESVLAELRSASEDY